MSLKDEFWFNFVFVMMLNQFQATWLKILTWAIKSTKDNHAIFVKFIISDFNNLRITIFSIPFHTCYIVISSTKLSTNARNNGSRTGKSIICYACYKNFKATITTENNGFYIRFLTVISTTRFLQKSKSNYIEPFRDTGWFYGHQKMQCRLIST